MKGIVVGMMMLALARAASGQTTVLYDASLGTPPTGQGWLTYFSSTFTNLFTADATGTLLETNAAAGTQAGFSNYSVLTNQLVNPAFPALDRTSGFTIHLEDMRLLSETHASIDRAGTSLLVIAGDGMGIELGFWIDRVFAQADSPLFTHAEEAGLTGGSTHDYDLRVQGSGYSLLVDGSIVLSGPLRDYSAFSGVPDPYELPNFVFLGDDTGSASSAVRFARVSVSVPEPGGMAILSAAIWAACGRRGRVRPSGSTHSRGGNGRPSFSQASL